MQNTDTLLLDEVRNTGLFDRTLRISIGAIAIVAVLANQDISMLGWIALVPLLAIYPIMTGLLGYDPFYDRLKTNTRKSSVISDRQLVKLFNTISGEDMQCVEKSNSIAKESCKSERKAA